MLESEERALARAQKPTTEKSAAVRIRELEQLLEHVRGIASAERRRADLLEATRQIAWRSNVRMW